MVVMHFAVWLSCCLVLALPQAMQSDAVQTWGGGQGE